MARATRKPKKLRSIRLTPRTRKPGRAILHPEFERVMARMREAFGAAPDTLPAPELYLGMARILIDEAMATHRSPAR